MTNRISAGLLMYRIQGKKPEVLLAHPGGPFFRNKDSGVWSIPKGEPGADEELLVTAKREFEEETGIKPETDNFIPLGTILQKGGKTVYCWAFEGNHLISLESKSNTFEMEWPPHSGMKMTFQEIDKVEFFETGTARKKIKDTQVPFIERLEEYLRNKT